MCQALYIKNRPKGRKLGISDDQFSKGGAGNKGKKLLLVLKAAKQEKRVAFFRIEKRNV